MLQRLDTMRLTTYRMRYVLKEDDMSAKGICPTCDRPVDDHTLTYSTQPYPQALCRAGNNQPEAVVPTFTSSATALAEPEMPAPPFDDPNAPDDGEDDGEDYGSGIAGDYELG